MCPGILLDAIGSHEEIASPHEACSLWGVSQTYLEHETSTLKITP